MSAKNLDKKGRFRSKTIAFRVSEEENRQLDRLVKLSGTTKQDYLTSNMLHRELKILGGPRVYRSLKSELDRLYGVINERGVEGLSSEDVIVMNSVVRLLYEMSGIH